MQVRIAKGDTLFSLARRHGMTLEQLLEPIPGFATSTSSIRVTS
ncbi:MAG: LysM peptidoglycan-binding domain-containing protein [Candidatus Sericytochromatia bacterium]|nr:LysM peptidoglycan-binding domain-containing protein [Candidatus Tanganyikabacteria bacterium]MBM4059443.1 LysM peptidoglycan-binding domain-containing protein [Planctomycetota bacterium]